MGGFLEVEHSSSGSGQGCAVEPRSRPTQGVTTVTEFAPFPCQRGCLPSYVIERSELSRRGSRHPARAALVYLARSRTMATNAELAAMLGLSRAESVPNLTRRFGAWLATDARLRKNLRSLEEELDETDHPK